MDPKQGFTMEKKECGGSCLELPRTSLVWLAILILAGLFTALTVLMINIEKDNEFIKTSLLPLVNKASENQHFEELKSVPLHREDFTTETVEKSTVAGNENLAKGEDIPEPGVRNPAENSREKEKNSEDEVEKLGVETEKIIDDAEKSMFDNETVRDEAEKSRVDTEKSADQIEEPVDDAENSGDVDDVSEEVQSGCAQGFTRISGVCYRFFKNGRAWNDAKQYCIRKGGFLAEPKSPEENKNIVDLVKARSKVEGRVWIGATDKDTEGHWVWAHSGTSIEYTDWAEGEPNDKDKGEDCTYLCAGRNYQWNDAPCGWAFDFVCQM